MKIKKVLLLLAILSITIFMTTSCGGDGGEPTFPSEPIEIVSTGISDSLNSFKEEAKDSTMSLSSYIGIEKEDLEKPRVQINLEVEAKDYDQNYKLHYKTLNNVKTDKSYIELGLLGSTTSVTFSGNDMIMSFFSTKEPMVKYTSDFSSTKDMNPFERYVKALELSKNLTFENTWSDDISKLSSDINSNLTSENVSMSNGTVMYHDTDVEADIYTLSADESIGGVLLKDVYNAMSNDEDINSYLTTMQNSDGLNTLKSVEAVVNDETKLSKTKLEAVVYVQEETFLACNMYFETPDGSFAIENNYYTNDSDRHIVNKVIFPSNVTLDATHTVYDQGSNTREDNSTFEMNVEGSDEPLKIVSENMITENGDNYSKDFNITYSGVNEEDETISSHGKINGKYESVTTDGEINGTFTGSYTEIEPDEGEETTKYLGTTALSETSPEISVPEFIENSGITFTDVNELKAYLNENNDSKTTGIENPFEQSSTAIVWMLRLSF
ncbi:MAG TPA: hypothetical protein VJ916_09390 [Anaerovoracaceae bacterium]|nr:hypothetical protein [Anaerovoracaceae bacterium]